MDGGEAGRGSKEKLEPRQVDAYWLQRELNKLYQDPIVSQKKVNEVMEILKVCVCVCGCLYLLMLIKCMLPECQ